MQGHSKEGEILGDYCDGSSYKNHPLFKTEHHALQIVLYYDELELCNPLGTSAKIHKIGKFEYGKHACMVATQCYACRSVLLSVGKHQPKISKFT